MCYQTDLNASAAATGAYCAAYICPHIELLFILLEVQCVLYSVFILQFLQGFPSHLFAMAHTSYIMQSDA